MKKISKSIFILFLLLLAAVFSGCSSKTKSILEEPFISEDANLAVFGNADQTILKDTEAGIYYTQNRMNGPDLHYYDKTTKQSIYLCNKPECLHDGNEFCAATNSRYSILGRKFYSDRIVMLALDNSSNTKSEFKILCSSKDGSSLEEFLTFYTMDNFGLVPNTTDCSMFIHRNKLIANISVQSENVGLEVQLHHGTFIIDLDSKEIKPLFDEPVSVDNPIVQNILPYDNCIFYATIVGSKPVKKTLYRYNLETGTNDEYHPAGFNVPFAVTDFDTVIYHKNPTPKINVFTLSTGAVKDYQVFFNIPTLVPSQSSTYTVEIDGDVQTFESYVEEHYIYPPAYGSSFLACDGTYIYAANNTNYYCGLSSFNIEHHLNVKDTDTAYQYLQTALFRYYKDPTRYTNASDDPFSPENFGKLPGAEFSYRDIMPFCENENEASLKNLMYYNFTLMNGKIILARESYDENNFVHNSYSICDAEAFFTGEAKFEPYFEY